MENGLVYGIIITLFFSAVIILAVYLLIKANPSFKNSFSDGYKEWHDDIVRKLKMRLLKKIMHAEIVEEFYPESERERPEEQRKLWVRIAVYYHDSTVEIREMPVMSQEFNSLMKKYG